MNMGKKNALAVAIGLSLAAPMSLQAQELEEILVTGTKRAASLEDAPLAVQVFTETAIQEAGITRPEDFLSLVPNVNFVTSNHEGEFFVNVRGQASVRFAESAVAVVIDGVQLATSNEFNQDFFDIEQIEVLKGPKTRSTVATRPLAPSSSIRSLLATSGAAASEQPWAIGTQ